MSPTAAHHLTTVIRHWTDLVDALGGTSAPVWPPAGRMSDYLRALDELDADELEAERHRALALRTLERDPSQIGERPIPIRLTVHETMRIVQAGLIECADQVAAVVQRPVMGPLPAGYPKADRERRELLVIQDRNDRRRWSWTGTRPGAPYAALWLLGRVQGAPGPFRPLPAPEAQLIANVARGAAERIEHVLDVGERTATLAQTCPRMIKVVFPCNGRIEMYGGAGAPPVARCTECGHVWTGQDVPAVA
ncbi:hypothetical protein SAMN04487981_101626 [Streptomyces sp. cf386]|uniref:hypothetical protein n=1 Tax=Streptomyces sp. cf386 TaxID=1761904 RepID=UPI00088B6230|nr:hypothetical protein [Streptomyces sp. cf386]SDM47056.1 hypothetical protein SAMN04487981_101626 [Streptomyces sp. cf386]